MTKTHPYNGPDERYGQKWNARRFLIFAKYNYICQICGKYSKGNMCLHHIRPIGISNDNSSRNLLPICNQCHYMIHQEYIENKKRFEV